MYCKYCGKKVSSQSKHCEYCGGLIQTHILKCENCGNVNDSDSNYCVSCGKRIRQEDKLKIQYILFIILVIMIMCTIEYLLNV